MTNSDDSRTIELLSNLIVKDRLGTPIGLTKFVLLAETASLKLEKLATTVMPTMLIVATRPVPAQLLT
jgi:hypothetical protein